jgi:chromate transporter
MSAPSAGAHDRGPVPEPRATLGEVASSYLRIGSTAFGGPASHLAMMRVELVMRRGWVSEQELLDFIGGASLLPGPTSTEVALMLARRRRGWAGLAVGGACFILPSVLLVLGLSWAYVRYGATDAGAGVLFGIKPVVVAIIASAAVGLARTAVKRLILAVVAGASLVAYFLGVSPLLILLAAALIVTAVDNGRRLARAVPVPAPVAVPMLAAKLHLAHRASLSSSRFARASLGALFLEFLKLGSIVFGSGYVLVTYLHSDLVLGNHWLTQSQLLATVAIGQLTPGPVFTTATSIGYVLGGLPGALLATVAIFVPSFLFVAALMPVLGRARRFKLSASALDGVNVAAIALMAGVTVQLGRTSLVDWLTVLTAVLSLGLLLRWRVNATWLVLGGVGIGLLHAFA